jgi:hypothetical protein
MPKVLMNPSANKTKAATSLSSEETEYFSKTTKLYPFHSDSQQRRRMCANLRYIPMSLCQTGETSKLTCKTTNLNHYRPQPMPQLYFRITRIEEDYKRLPSHKRLLRRLTQPQITQESTKNHIHLANPYESLTRSSSLSPPKSLLRTKVKALTEQLRFKVEPTRN